MMLPSLISVAILHVPLGHFFHFPSHSLAYLGTL